ncbi:hypothetical protein DSN97_04780 [Deferribacteraceae bacterium V6Fe1]|nr:hypothetical protein DSN97_04780 [Deferribacteraceae bacterium V6Fe1]
MKTFFKRFKSAIVALSGGADSAAVLKLTCEHLPPENILAVTCVNNHVFRYEIDNARLIADALCVAWKPFYIDYDDNFIKNNEQKCYYCKRSILAHINKIKKSEKIDVIFDGTNLDDLNDYRPGMKAVKEYGVVSPLKELGLTKSDSLKIVNNTFKSIHFHDESCIATRILNNPIQSEDIIKIEKIEDRLRDIYPGIRVRVGDNIKVEFKKLRKLDKSDIEFLKKVIKFQYADKHIHIDY